MKFALEDIGELENLITELSPGLKKLSFEDNVEGFLVKDLKFRPKEKKTIANQLEVIPTKFIIVDQVGSGNISRQYSKARLTDENVYPTPNAWSQTQLFLVNTSKEATIVSIFFMR